MSIRKYSCIHVTARSEYCCKCSAETRDDAIALDDSFVVCPTLRPDNSSAAIVPTSPSRTKSLLSTSPSNHSRIPSDPPLALVLLCVFAAVLCVLYG